MQHCMWCHDCNAHSVRLAPRVTGSSWVVCLQLALLLFPSPLVFLCGCISPRYTVASNMMVIIFGSSSVWVALTPQRLLAQVLHAALGPTSPH